ncbi:protein NEGATIVE GRAVITROPIC RESPONSE OF ROOTS-like [Tripterygium wilfordii]|uniref:protein NEGATIVE GRAVITROPIC RESPONSE OF ROOTS-like n=1 Tax=Tripterygium wilfordii TaxID=458696 RepID=UPI0018F80150|nr:protein NEGATIVE GRAVITROPIC RESPONSE OF ROOTS-like [Tripterygium wilfordii]
MKIFQFQWMQNKITGRSYNHNRKNPASTDHYLKQQVPEKEEFSDWPDGLLAIGTFGNNKDTNTQENSPQDHQQEEFSPEEVGQLQTEFNISILHDDQQGFESERRAKDDADLDQSNSKKTGHLHRSTSLVVARGKDNNMCLELDSSRRSGLINGKKSFSFLLKKVFACRGGFTPAPSLKDQIPDSRMDKLLRLILRKKIHPQSSASTFSAAKKYLENRHMKSEEEPREEGSKWILFWRSELPLHWAAAGELLLQGFLQGDCDACIVDMFSSGSQDKLMAKNVADYSFVNYAAMMSPHCLFDSKLKSLWTVICIMK